MPNFDLSLFLTWPVVASKYASSHGISGFIPRCSQAELLQLRSAASSWTKERHSVCLSSVLSIYIYICMYVMLCYVMLCNVM